MEEQQIRGMEEQQIRGMEEQQIRGMEEQQIRGMEDQQQLNLVEWGALGVPQRSLKTVATGRLRVIRKQDGGNRLIFDGREGNKLLRGIERLGLSSMEYSTDMIG